MMPAHTYAFTVRHHADPNLKMEVREECVRRYEYFQPLLRGDFNEARSREIGFEEEQIPLSIMDIVFQDPMDLISQLTQDNFIKTLKALDFLCLRCDRSWSQIAERCANFVSEESNCREYLYLCLEAPAVLACVNYSKFRTSVAKACVECPEALGLLMRKDRERPYVLKIVHKMCELIERGWKGFDTVTGERFFCALFSNPSSQSGAAAQSLVGALTAIWRQSQYHLPNTHIFNPNPFETKGAEIPNSFVPGLKLKFFASAESGKAAETGFKFKEYEAEYKGFDRCNLPALKDVKVFGFHMTQAPNDTTLRCICANASLRYDTAEAKDVQLVDCRTKYEDISLGFSPRTSQFYFYASVGSRMQGPECEKIKLADMKIKLEINLFPLRTLSLYLIRRVVGGSAHDSHILQAFSAALSPTQLAVHAHGIFDYLVSQGERCRSPLILMNSWFSQCHEQVSAWHASRLIESMYDTNNGKDVVWRNADDTIRFLRDSKRWLPSEQFKEITTKFYRDVDGNSERVRSSLIAGIKRFVAEEEPAVRNVRPRYSWS
ncbi:unnamed protein product [Vitrella brassicaformis CCMP3155]|uniref:Uncharacterized protein n=1 Tax=Vitrella brassicaformis (strain CCMP3155) TaxID=1169540 RepID=A0A0G4FB18_VITBC|nr:unnamed protein product [Vitrella brassicaformis CCMP3155]|mmetsp:Transcript_39015/g.97658  ORF Transcript_39015/g.97658 Transcript_39015/m.97658 type:complete len:548 (-) Transcript_39015:674-2317(-)|eukprot:CEM10118.1 unnamed protein product [Vitrella brassicaformis CCMP3155]